MQNRTFSVLFDDYDLSGVNETINVLESGVHTIYQWDINSIPEFDSNDKRWELYQSPKAWEFITEDYRGFWDWIRESKNFKVMMWLDDANTGPQFEHITAMTDNAREFLQNRIYQTTSLPHTANQDYQHSMRNMLNGKSKLMFFWNYYSGDTYYRQLWILKYNPETTKTEPYLYPGSDGRGYRVLPVNQGFFNGGPWMWSCSEFSFLTDNDDKIVVHPGGSDSTPAGAISERENFVLTIHGAAKPTRLLYGIDDKEHFLYESLNVDERAKPVFTNTNETHLLMVTNTKRLDFVDRKKQEHKIVVPNIDIALPDIETKCTLSPDGTMFAWTDRTGNTPRLRIIRIRDGQVIYTSAINGPVSNAIWTNSNVIYVNSTTNVMSRYVVAGTAEQLFVQEVSNYIIPTTGGDYMASYLEDIRKILYVKRTTANNLPLYYILDENTGRVDYTAPNSNYIGVRVFYGCQSLVRRVPNHDDWFLIPTTTANMLILLKYNKSNQLWTETVLLDSQASTNTDQYAQYTPVFFDNGTICAWVQHNRADSRAVPIYDLNTGKTIEVLPSQTWEVIRKLDESHLAYNGNSYTAIYEIDKVNRKVIEKTRQVGRGRSLFYGFNDD